MYLFAIALISLFFNFFTSYGTEIAYSIIMAGVFVELVTTLFSRKKAKKQEEKPGSLSEYMNKEYGVKKSSTEADQYSMLFTDSKNDAGKKQ